MMVAVLEGCRTFGQWRELNRSATPPTSSSSSSRMSTARLIATLTLRGEEGGGKWQAVSGQPVLDLEGGYPGEVTHVVGHDGVPVSQGGGADQQVFRANALSVKR